MPTLTAHGLYTQREAAELMNCSAYSVRRLIAAGSLRLDPVTRKVTGVSIAQVTEAQIPFLPSIVQVPLTRKQLRAQIDAGVQKNARGCSKERSPIRRNRHDAVPYHLAARPWHGIASHARRYLHTNAAVLP